MYVSTWKAFVYVAFVIDFFARRVARCHVSSLDCQLERIGTELGAGLSEPDVEAGFLSMGDLLLPNFILYIVVTLTHL
jgi:hypothetical protein